MDMSSPAEDIPASGFLEARPWLPRYRASVIAHSGKTLASRKFWRRSHAKVWMLSYTIERRYQRGI